MEEKKQLIEKYNKNCNEAGKKNRTRRNWLAALIWREQLSSSISAILITEQSCRRQITR